MVVIIKKKTTSHDVGGKPQDGGTKTKIYNFRDIVFICEKERKPREMNSKWQVSSTFASFG